MKALYLLLAVTLFLPQALQSQTKSNNAMTALLQKYISAINALETDNSSAKTLDLYSSRYTGTTTYVKLSGGVIKKSYTKKDIKNQLDDIVQDDEYRIAITLNKVLYNNQKDKAGTISALLDFTSYIDNKEAEKGTMLFNIVAVKLETSWKIFQNNMVRISETKEIGDCVCHVYNKDNSKYVTELYYPAGVTYDHKFESFQFTATSSKELIKTKGATYEWNKKTGVITAEKKVIGNATTQKKAIEVLTKLNFTEPCKSIIFR